MEIHKPKAAHSWREFLIEIGIIVIGVLIALGAEQAVGWARVQRQARENEEAIRSELQGDAVNAAERLMVADCTRDRIKHLTAKLAGESGRWSADPQPFENGSLSESLGAIPETLHEPSRVWLRTAWDTAVHSEAIRLLPSDRRTRLTATFDQIGHIAQEQDAELLAEAQLAPLSLDLTLSADARARLLSVLGQVDHHHRLGNLIASQIVSDARSLGVEPDPKELAAIFAHQRGYRGACVHEPKLK